MQLATCPRGGRVSPTTNHWQGVSDRCPQQDGKQHQPPPQLANFITEELSRSQDNVLWLNHSRLLANSTANKCQYNNTKTVSKWIFKDYCVYVGTVIC